MMNHLNNRNCRLTHKWRWLCSLSESLRTEPIIDIHEYVLNSSACFFRLLRRSQPLLRKRSEAPRTAEPARSLPTSQSSTTPHTQSKAIMHSLSFPFYPSSGDFHNGSLNPKILGLKHRKAKRPFSWWTFLNRNCRLKHNWRRLIFCSDHFHHLRAHNVLVCNLNDNSTRCLVGMWWRPPRTCSPSRSTPFAHHCLPVSSPSSWPVFTRERRSSS